jgi:hypothetical protein
MMRYRWLGAAVLVIALVGLWQAVFYATGLAGAKAAPAKVAPPAPVALGSTRTDWVDMNVWSRTHPRWQPDD